MNQPNFEQLVQQIWNRRRVCRPRGIPTSPTWTLIQEDTERTLTLMLQRLDEANSFDLALNVEQMECWLSEAFRAVLSRDRLQSLAIEVQQTEPKTLERQIRMTDLIGAIQLSGHLSRPPRLSNPEYADATNQLFGYMAKHIDSYSAEKGEFVKWLNFRLSKIPREMYRETEKPMNRHLQDMIRRNRYALQKLAWGVDPSLVWAWMKALCKRVVPDCSYAWDILFLVSLLLELAIADKRERWNKAVSILLDIPLDTVFVTMGEDNNLNNIEDEPDQAPSRIMLLRQCLQTDETGTYGARHIKKHPEATFQAIALARLDGMSWDELAQHLCEVCEAAQNGSRPADEPKRGSNSDGQPIPVGTLSTFYQRSLKTFRPMLAACINEELAH